jgi:hypothetical protein
VDHERGGGDVGRRRIDEGPDPVARKYAWAHASPYLVTFDVLMEYAVAMTRNALMRRGPLRGSRPSRSSLRTLSDRELETELTIAAAASGSHRLPRYEALLGERNARRRLKTG